MFGKMPDKELIDWLRLASVNWLGATVKAGLIKEFKSPAAIFNAPKERLAKVKGWDYKRLERFIKERSLVKPVCSVQELKENNINLVTFNDFDYPELLREIPDSPVVLFYKGNIKQINSSPCIAMVGARKATQIGYDIAREFGYELAKAGFTVVSGLALGIDTYAHRGAVEANGKTAAVLGCGLNVIYPKSNRHIREKILKNNGVVISEYAPSVTARAWHFPVRNRIISGMCLGTLVVEASARSGSLITARLAAEQNREVFAIPGNIRSRNSQGTLNLLREGATLVTSPSEMIEYFSSFLPEKEKQEPKNDFENLSDDEKKIVKILSNEPIPLDNLIDESGIKRDRLFSLLLTLEMRNYLIRLPGNFYQAKIKNTA